MVQRANKYWYYSTAGTGVFYDEKILPVQPRQYNDIDVVAGMDITQYLPHAVVYQDTQEARQVNDYFGLYDEHGKSVPGVTLKSVEMLDLSLGYDTETTTIKRFEQPDQKTGKYRKNQLNPDGTPKVCCAYGYIYYYQLSIGSTIFHIRKWDDLVDVVMQIKEFYQVKLDPVRPRLLRVLDFNLGFEFQFLKDKIEIANMFSMAKREPVKILTVNGFMFQDASKLAPSLASLAKNYNLPTQKAKGDLSYNLIRNSQTVLSKKEKYYCSCDVRILSEMNEYLVNNYVRKGYKYPLTSTGFVRHDVKTNWNKWKYFTRVYQKNIKLKNGSVIPKTVRTRYQNTLKEYGRISESYPKTYGEYCDCINHLFSGGFTHGNFWYAGLVQQNVNGWDFTSSYPYTMIYQKFPMDEWWRLDFDVTPKDILDTCDGFAYRFKAVIKGLKAKTTHSIISLSKTAEYMENISATQYIMDYNAIIDNGRIYESDKVTVWGTDLDLQSWVDCYEWDSIVLSDVYRSTYDYLPDYLRVTVAKYYEIKTRLKRAGLQDTAEYKFAKAMVNACYGMMCEHLHLYEYQYINAEWESLCVEDIAEYYDNHVYSDGVGAQTPFNPYWGVWVTAHARRNLLKCVFDMPEDTIYCDTDSMYVRNPDEHESYFNDFNILKKAENKAIIDMWNGELAYKKKHDTADMYRNGIVMDADMLADLGTFDKIGKDNYTRFSHNGAKRYIKESPNGEIEQTIAGLPKHAVEDYLSKTGLQKDAFEIFADGMYIPGCKLCHAYNDIPHADVVTDYQGHTETMVEMSSVGLYPIGFCLGLADEYIEILKTRDKYISSHERSDTTGGVSTMDLFEMSLIKNFVTKM